MSKVLAAWRWREKRGLVKCDGGVVEFDYFFVAFVSRS